MKTLAGGGSSGKRAAPEEWRNGKIKATHLERLAVVYVRQSTLQQVHQHRESTDVRYQLGQMAQSLGWRSERTHVIDEDLGHSGRWVEGRQGYQDLAAEVSLGHVGIVIGFQMSRLARSCRDMYQLMDLCSLHGTLIADLDGVYDPSQFSDRLVLGLKGQMSEAELHMITQRMREGRLNKARRGELVTRLPIGYVRRLSGQVILDPDEHVQDTVRLIFDKFAELRTMNAVLRFLVGNDIKIGIRAHTGSDRGELEWRRPCRPTLLNMLHNPMYAGAYVYGRKPTDPRCQRPGRPNTGKVVAEREDWLVCLKDRFPAYISWERYEQNLAILRSNRVSAPDVGGGAPRNGSGLLGGMLFCGRCGYRMTVHYTRGHAHYSCTRLAVDYGLPRCQRLSARRLDEFVTSRLLDLVNPASLELSLQAASVIEKDRERLHRDWQHRLERARYETYLAARQYGMVEPENRLVARTLESAWEEKLREQQSLQEEYERFSARQPKTLTQTERERIRALAGDIPRIWTAESTTNQERKSILRELVHAVRVTVLDNTQLVDVEIEWVGGAKTVGQMCRAVAKWEQTTTLPGMLDRMRQLFEEGKSCKDAAEVLHQEGWRPPKRHVRITAVIVRQLAVRWGLAAPTRQHSQPTIERCEHEWTITELARELDMPVMTLHAWVSRGVVTARRAEARNRPLWLIRADDNELERLRAVRQRTPGQSTREKWLRNQDPST